MKKNLFVLCCVLFILPVNAKNSYNFINDDDIKLDKSINGSSLLVGTSINNKSIIDGVNIVVGSNIKDESKSEYSVLVGEDISTDGTYNKDSLIIGNSVNLNGKFNRDLFMVGNTITINGIIERDLKIYATSVNFENVVINGNIYIKSTTITVGDNVIINGNLKYNDDAIINGNMSNYNTKTYTLDKDINDNITTSLLSLACSMFLYVTIVLIYPNIFNRLNAYSFKNIFLLMGKGSFLLISGPILIVALFMIKIGMYLSLLLLAIYIILILLSVLISSYFIGKLIWNRFIKKDDNILLSGLIGIIITTLICKIPILSIFVILLGMGLSLEFFKRSK